MTKFILLSDIHFHNWSQFSTLDNNVNSRLKDILNVCNEATDYAKKHKIKHMILCGDTFHKRGTVDVITMIEVQKWLTRSVQLGIQIYILVGNHDQAVINASYNVMDLFETHTGYYGEGSVEIISEATTLPMTYKKGKQVCCKTFYFVPFEENYLEIQKKLQSDDCRKADFLVGHFGVYGAKLVNTDLYLPNSVKLKDAKFDNLTAGFLGHYHVHQQVLADPPVYYVGSPLHHTFHDTGHDKGFVVGDFESPKIKHIKTSYPEFCKIEANNDEEIIHQTKGHNYYRIICNNFTPSAKTLETIEGIAKSFEIVPIYKKQTNLDQKTEFDYTQIIKDYLAGTSHPNKAELYKELKQLANDKY